MSSDLSSPRFLIVGGGSGGHISPGLAVAEVITRTGGECLFLCSKRTIDATMLNGAGVSFEPLPAQPFGTRPAALARCLLGMRRSSKRIREILNESRYSGVLALGGFVAAGVLPGLLSARSRGILDGPIVLLNLDRIPGKANRTVAKRADLVVSAVDTVKAGFASQITGLPIRAKALASTSPEECRKELGLDPKQPTLFITGASQGASSLNRLMLRLLESGGLTDGDTSYQVIHLTGTGEAESLAQAYEQFGIHAFVSPFMDEIRLAWGAASITVSRAGANSVGEIQANSVPTIFLPYPHHRDRHQFHNAEPLVEAGGALLIEDQDDLTTASAVGRELKSLLRDDSRLDAMKSALAAQATPGAADAVAALLGIKDP